LLAVGVLAVLAAGAGFYAFEHVHQAHVAASRTRTQVRTAYLAMYSSVEQAYGELSTAPLNSHFTSAGLAQEDPLIQQAQQAGSAYRLSARHNLQTVIYSDNQTASVDDILNRSTTPLDPSSGVATAPEESDVIHESTILKLQGGHWLVDSIIPFGGPVAVGSEPASYATVPGDYPVSKQLQAAGMLEYLDYWTRDAEAFQRLQPDLLSAVEVEPELSQDESAIQESVTAKQPLRVTAQHNAVVAQQDDSTLWVYDTLLGSQQTISAQTGRPFGRPTGSVERESVRLKKVGAEWKVDYIILDQ
jgi:hypothetical protein